MAQLDPGPGLPRVTTVLRLSCAGARVRVRRTELVRSFSTDDSSGSVCATDEEVPKPEDYRISERDVAVDVLNHVDGPSPHGRAVRSG